MHRHKKKRNNTICVHKILPTPNCQPCIPKDTERPSLQTNPITTKYPNTSRIIRRTPPTLTRGSTSRKAEVWMDISIYIQYCITTRASVTRPGHKPWHVPPLLVHFLKFSNIYQTPLKDPPFHPSNEGPQSNSATGPPQQYSPVTGCLRPHFLPIPQPLKI